MNESSRLGKLAPYSNIILALLALLLGVLLGLFIVTPALDGFGGPLDRLSDLLLPVMGAAVLAMVGLFSPLAALLLWLLLAPYSSHIPLDISLGAGIPDLSLTRFMAGFLLLLVLAQAARGRLKLRPLTWADLAYGVFLFALGLGAFQSQLGTTFAIQSILDAYLVPFLALYLARQIVRDLGNLRWYTVALTIVGVSFAFLIIREQITGEVLLHTKESAAYSRSFRKIVSLMGNAAPMGVSTALTLPLALVALVQAWYARELPPRRRYLAVILLALATGIIALAVYMTYNRASWLGMALTVLALLLLRPRSRRVLLPVLLVAAIGGLVFWQAVASSAAVNERLLEDASLGYRATAANIAFEIARSDPIFGVGYFNFGPIAKASYGWDPLGQFGVFPPAHNTFLFLLVSGGLFALLAYLAWMALVAWGGIGRYALTARIDRPEVAMGKRDALAAGAAVYLTYFLASATFDNAEAIIMNLIFYMTLGAIWGATESMK
ncbi:MAG: O-antigen ligase family protein [Chloroflexota bacterium]|nr:O-antigen ligase family protein [Chloroflexota bacterium]